MAETDSGDLAPCPTCGKVFDHDNTGARTRHVDSCDGEEEPDVETQTVDGGDDENEPEPENEDDVEEEPDEPPAPTPDGGATETATTSTAGFETIIRADPLQTFIDHVHPVVDEAKFSFSAANLSVRAVDPANVQMVDAALTQRGFEHYGVERETVLGFNIERFDDVVSPASADDLVHLTYDAETRRLLVEWGGHEWKLALIDPDSIRQEPDIPDLDLPVDATIDAGSFADGLEFADGVSDHVELASVSSDHSEADGDDEFVVAAEGDTDEYRGAFAAGDQVTFAARPNGKVSSLMSLDYLLGVGPTFDSDGEIDIELGDEFPVKIHGDITDDEGDGVGEVTYMQAPRIQSD